jgi:hypothetical protein
MHKYDLEASRAVVEVIMQFGDPMIFIKGLQKIIKSKKGLVFVI